MSNWYKKKKCRAWHFPLLMFSYRPCTLAGVERLHKRSGWGSSDIQMLMMGGEQGANHHVLRHRENHACQEALAPREPPETGLRRLGRAWSVFQGRITGICCWSLVSLSELQPLPLCFNQTIQIEAVEGSCVGLCLLQHHYPHFPPLSACAS